MTVKQGSLGVIQGTAYCVTIVLGAGVLTLPGYAYKLAGQKAIWAWLADFVLSFPILFVFSRLVRHRASAAGIGDFIKLAFGESLLFRFVQVLLLITLAIGTGAIAMTGASYVLGEGTKPATRLLVSMSLVVFPAALNSFGVKFGSICQQLAAASLIFTLATAVAISYPHWSTRFQPNPDANHATSTVAAMIAIWFAFAGVEQMTFLSGDFVNHRAFICSIICGFMIVGALYLGFAFAIQRTLICHDPLLVANPLRAVLERAGQPTIAGFAGLVGAGIVLINLTATILSGSRFVSSVADDGVLLPRRAAQITLFGVSQFALWGLVASAVITIGVAQLAGLTFTYLLTVASQNWMVLYILSIVAYARCERTIVARVIATVTACLIVVFTWTNLAALLILSGGLAIAAGLTYLDKHRRFRRSKSHVELIG